VGDKGGGKQALGEKMAIPRNNLREISATREFCGMFLLHQVPLHIVARQKGSLRWRGR